MGRLFGTDGVRGLANVSPMDSETALQLGRAAAFIFRRFQGRHRILIGKDTRISGYMLEAALASGITSMGVDVLQVGPLPTPGVAYMTRSMRADAGVMISASHNSYEDNGIKFFGHDGFKLPDDMEDEIEKLMEPGRLNEHLARGEKLGKMFRIDDAIGRYTVYLKSCVSRDITFDGLKVVMDLANGAAYKVAPLVYAELGAAIVTHGDRPDGTNINHSCGSTHPDVIGRLVREHSASFGIAFDGDADRVVLCDEQGQVFDGDMILALLANDFQRRGLLRGNGVVGTVMSNFGLEKTLANWGVALHRSDVGDRYVLAEMMARGMNLGGEQSGHIISLDHNTTGDGILTSLLVASVLVREGQPLSAYQGLIRKFPQVILNVAVREKKPFEQIPEVAKMLSSVESRLRGRGRVLLRYSGTERKARIMVECDETAMCDALAKELADVVRKELAP